MYCQKENHIQISERISQESVTDPSQTIRADDLAELSIADLIDIIRKEEKFADCDMVEAALVKREEKLKAKLEMYQEQLKVAKVAQLTADVRLKAKEMEVEEREKAPRQLEMMLRIVRHKNKITVRQMNNKANELMAQIDNLRRQEQYDVAKWHELAHMVTALENKHKLLLSGAGVEAEQTAHGCNNQEPTKQNEDGAGGI